MHFNRNRKQVQSTWETNTSDEKRKNLVGSDAIYKTKQCVLASKKVNTMAVLEVKRVSDSDVCEVGN